MYSMNIRLIFSISLCFLFSSCSWFGSTNVERLRCEGEINPDGIDMTTPRLSWEIISGKRGVRQTAYIILVASSLEKLNNNEGDLWDSGEVTSDQSIWIPYEGKPLTSGMACFWKVKITTNRGESKWSDPAFWTIGLLDGSDWEAQWIGLDKMFAGDTLAHKSRLSARYLRKEFETEKQKIQRATLYISGLGLYEAYINGEKIGDHVLTPALTDYSQSVKYNTFDVTSRILKSSSNTLAVALGNGRYFSTRFEGSGRMRHFGFPKLLAQLEIVYENGDRQTIVSDTTWKITPFGPIRANNEFDGEVYDAREQLRGWSKNGYDDGDWLPVELVEAPKGRLSAQINRNMKIMETLQPVSINEIEAQTYILDMGQNMVGWLQMKVSANEGDTIRLRFAETLKPDGTLYTANLRRAEVTDYYICKGGEGEIWEPTFVYHGFRYVEVSGTEFHIDDFMGKVIYDEMETIGSFETSDSTLNQIYRNAYWGIRGNYLSIPTDCPQRDERQGWLGDRTTGAYGESFIFDNHGLYVKWLDDIQQTQREDGSISDVAPIFWHWSGYTDNMTWPHAYLTIADMLYKQFGDLHPIQKHYNSMKKWLGYMRSKYLEEDIMPRDRYGDWCLPPESLDLIHSGDSTRITSGPLLGTAFYYRSLFLMEYFAGLLQKDEDVKTFAEEKERVKHAFHDTFFTVDKQYYGNNTVTANLIPLCFGMVPKEHENAVFQHIENEITGKYKSHVSTGVIGIQWLMRGLTAYGRDDLALRIATNRDYPSWGYMIENGASTIWELWNGNTADPSMNSGNHVMLLGDLLVWYYENLAGIRNAPLSTAFKRIEMKPLFPDKLDWVNASCHSPYGKIESSWKKQNGGFSWNITVPVNSSARIYIPVPEINSITENGKAISSIEDITVVGIEDGNTVLDFGSGKYSFSWDL